eukprot:UN03415
MVRLNTIKTYSNERGKHYPLCVKLGTITADGGEVYDYKKNAPVKDPYLAKHLAHWGYRYNVTNKDSKNNPRNGTGT